LFAPTPYFQACAAMQWCHVIFSLENLCCHGNQPFLFKDKIGCRLTRASNAETQLLGYSVAMGQIPPSTECISSFFYIFEEVCSKNKTITLLVKTLFCVRYSDPHGHLLSIARNPQRYKSPSSERVDFVHVDELMVVVSVRGWVRGDIHHCSERWPGGHRAATDYQWLDFDAEEGQQWFRVVRTELGGISWRVWISGRQRQLLAWTITTTTTTTTATTITTITTTTTGWDLTKSTVCCSLATADSESRCLTVATLLHNKKFVYCIATIYVKLKWNTKTVCKDDVTLVFLNSKNVLSNPRRGYAYGVLSFLLSSVAKRLFVRRRTRQTASDSVKY